MSKERIKQLLEKQIAMQLTATEQDELLALLSQPDQDEVNEILAAQFAAFYAENENSNEEAKMSIFNTVVRIDKLPADDESPAVIAALPNTAKIRQMPLKRYWLAAAAILAIFFTGTVFWNNSHETTDKALASQPATTIAPGIEGAVLTLADGTQVVLDSMGNGQVANQNGVSVALNNGELTYASGGSVDGTILYNTMSTPRGRQFMVVLPDGTRVWLNSASTLRYPVAFAQDERLVEVSGEAYFEVAKNPGRPFRVNVSDKAQVEVIGTHFNINAYENEVLVKTTLLEGSVSMHAGTALTGEKKENNVMLKPGQQAQLKTSETQNPSSGEIKIVDQVDLINVMAWKNHVFNFEGMHLKEIMKQLERWYDIEVEFENGVKDIEFYGELSMNNSLNEVIEAFKDAEVHFKIEGRKLIVMKN